MLSLTCSHLSIEKVVLSIKISHSGLIAFPNKYSTETVARVLCEINVALDLLLIDKINASTTLGFGLDETPDQNSGRSFLEIHLYGQVGTQPWCELYKGMR